MNNNPALGIIDKIVDFVNRLTDQKNVLQMSLKLIRSCMILIVIYVFLFIYKRK